MNTGQHTLTGRSVQNIGLGNVHRSVADDAPVARLVRKGGEVVEWNRRLGQGR